MATTTQARPARAAGYDQAPFIVFWETTRACDLACKHCRACAIPDRDWRELTTDEGKALLAACAAMGARRESRSDSNRELEAGLLFRPAGEHESLRLRAPEARGGEAMGARRESRSDSNRELEAGLLFRPAGEHESLRLRAPEARGGEAMGARLVVLTGGDPAKRSDLVELVRHGAALGLRMALTPSATPLITRELLAQLRDAGLARLAISLDGAPRAHDSFRGVAGSHARTLEILRDARELGITTQINTSVSRFNADDMPAIARSIAELGIELWSVFFVVPTGRGRELACLGKDEVEALLVWLSRLAEDSPFDVKTTAAPQFRRVLLQRKVARGSIVGLDGIGRAARGVNDGQGTVFVSHVGDVYPSGFLPIACGNVREASLAAIYREHSLFRALRRPDELGGKCGECEFRKVCGGSRARAFAVTGDPLAEDPSCAYVPRSTRAR